MLLLTLLAAQAMANSELIATSEWKNPTYSIHAEIYMNKKTRKPDLWVHFEGMTGDEKDSFTATSIPSRLKDADYRLRAAPILHLGPTTSVIFDAYDVKTKDWNGDHGFALIFHYGYSPLELPESLMDDFERQFPGSVVRDAKGYPDFVHALLDRITWRQVYPVAAFKADY